MAHLDYYKDRKLIPWKRIDGTQDKFPTGGVLDGNRVAVFSFNTVAAEGLKFAYIDTVVDSVRIKKLFPGEKVKDILSKCLEGKEIEGYSVGDWDYCVLIEFDPPLKGDPIKVLRSVVRSFSKKFGELLEKQK